MCSFRIYLSRSVWYSVSVIHPCRTKAIFISFWIYIWLKHGQDVHFKFGQFTFSWPLCGLNLKYKKCRILTWILVFSRSWPLVGKLDLPSAGFLFRKSVTTRKLAKITISTPWQKRSPYPVSDSRVWKCTVLGSVMVSFMGSVIGSVLVSDMRSVKGFVMRSETVKPILIWVKLIWEAKFCEERLRQLTPAPSTGLVCYNYFGE